MSSSGSAVPGARTSLLTPGDEESNVAQRRPVDVRLHGYVLGYRGFHLGPTVGQWPVSRLVAPDGTVKLMFGFAAPVRMVDLVNPDRSLTAVSVVGAVSLTAVVGRHSGRVHGLVTTLTPMGAYRLFGVPMHEWSELRLAPSELLGPGLRSLDDRLAQCPTWEDRFQLLDRLFTARILDGPMVDREVEWVWRELQRSGGRIPIHELAASANWSRRHLERRFREQVGRSPKEIAQIRRIQQALHWKDAGLPLAQIAARSGFHDQSHFTRVFKAAMGFTPRQLPEGMIDWSPHTLLEAVPEGGQQVSRQEPVPA